MNVVDVVAGMFDQKTQAMKPGRPPISCWGSRSAPRLLYFFASLTTRAQISSRPGHLFDRVTSIVCGMNSDRSA